MSGMSYDWNKISEVASTLGDSQRILDEQLAIIDSEITTKMSASWSGPSWNAFNTYYTTYKTGTIDPLAKEIKAWVEKLKTLSETAHSTQTNNAGLFGGGGDA